MLLRHLSYFLTLAKEQHFARAAQACNITQPTLSAAIRKLELDLGVPLVVRGHRFVGLTAEGEKALVWGRQILTDYNSLRDDLAGAQQGMTGVLRLGVIPAAMPSVSILSASFTQANPAAVIDIRSLTSRAIAEGLENFELDGGITYLENEPIAHVRRVHLYHERYKLIVSKDHPLAGRGHTSWQEAVNQRLCLLSQDMQNRRIIDQVARLIGVEIQPAITSNSFLAICPHLRHGYWASIVPHTFLHVFNAAPDLEALDLVDPVHSEAIGLVISDREPRSPMVGALLAAALSVDLETEFAAVERQT
jgi:DNA-binding transcriptional LysR family regulator